MLFGEAILRDLVQKPSQASIKHQRRLCSSPLLSFFAKPTPMQAIDQVNADIFLGYGLDLDVDLDFYFFAVLIPEDLALDGPRAIPLRPAPLSQIRLPC
jgi:hypothetical protein